MTAQLGNRDVIIQSDCQQVISLTNNQKTQVNEIGLIVEEIRHYNEMFQSCSVSHIRRESNIPAHYLAKFSSKFDTFKVWNCYGPPWLNSLIEANLPV